ncbi:hypothetical protein GCM10023084_77260 [Streptomyces lacrimifluminis]|uniref:DNA polymerase III beta sliding clamp N-terminal domain-containing protein n=1 Tax=Streptomyces lacrimifluminis TaxID=1500077 RepID=A0A917P8L3_9ACTN|nr:hypothetical protein [Streptomyces lacrimifluminis]GGJ66837.1 hypothetical protein GCM10012282_74740 [Streptomyces lacrimifluminis]
MKLTIDTDKVADTAQWALHAIPGNPPAPVLAGMRLEADDNTLLLSSFDYYRSARAREAVPRRQPSRVRSGWDVQELGPVCLSAPVRQLVAHQ